MENEIREWVVLWIEKNITSATTKLHTSKKQIKQRKKLFKEMIKQYVGQVHGNLKNHLFRYYSNTFYSCWLCIKVDNYWPSHV
jgi:deoxyxylulose-5-phosphate synthase